ncbi:MAG: hypothetical protein Q8N26_03270 [Myxococcales bacterium]|nr:hypothetical protein [Myxococcales bacterium]
MRVLLACLSICLLLWAEPAWSCIVSCAGRGWLGPGDGATDVPLNVQLRFWSSLSGVELFRGDERVPADRVEEGGVAALVPRQVLAPLTMYSVRVRGAALESGPTFTTGTEVDSTPPTVGAPTLRSFRPPLVDSSSCGGPRFEFFSLAYDPQDDRTAAGQLIHLGFVGTTVDDIGLDAPTFGTTGLLIIESSNSCGDSTLPDLMKRPQLAALAVVVDLAGNRSAPSQAVQVKGSGGCSAAGGSLALLSAILVPLRRLRRTC